MFLPIYGGCYFVWGACLVFFQAILLLGYWFVHKTIQRFGVTRYRMIFLILVFVPFLFFPGRLITLAHNNPSSFLMGDIVWKLSLTIGPVFFVLSTVSTSLQMWLSKSFIKEKNNPYKLFASSNAGSLIALLSYPFIFELFLDLHQQQQIWRIGYCALAFLTITLFKIVPIKPNSQEKNTLSTPIPKTQSLTWILLSAASAMMFMAVTNIITSAVGPIPLVWIMPLGIYLITFILSFKKNPWDPGWIQKYIAIVLTVGAYAYFYLDNQFLPLQDKIIWLGLITFLTCLYCHNKLASSGTRSGYSLTNFYITIALGSFLGGIFTTWIAPLLSNFFIEYLVALTFIVCALWIQTIQTHQSNRKKFYILKLVSTLFVPLCLIYFLVKEGQNNDPHILYKSRNYYGLYEVFESDKIRSLIHQTTMHGAQLQDKRILLEPSSFYSRTSPIGEIFRSKLFDSRSMGVIGLGVGTLAIYTEPGDVMDYYELDPEIYLIAKKYFTYLNNAKGNIRFFFGDARLSLAKETEKKYGILVMDAFGGSSIPTHLLTKEAILNYQERLSENGILLFHISSNSVNLEPVLSGLASDLHAYVAFRSTPGSPYGLPSMWVALTWNKAQYNKLVIGLKWRPILSLSKKIHRLWTDQYSSILPILNYPAIQSIFSLRKVSEDLRGAFISTSPVNE